MKRSAPGSEHENDPSARNSADVVDERRCRAMVERALPCRRVLDELERGLDDGLQRDLTVGRRLGNRSDESGDPGEDACRQVGLRPRIRAVFVRLVRIHGARLVVSAQPSEREAVGRASPARFGAGKKARSLPGGEAFVLRFNAKIAGLEQTTEVARRRSRFRSSRRDR